MFPTRTFATFSAIENRRKKSSRGLHVAYGPYVVQAWINVLNEAVTMGARINFCKGGVEHRHFAYRFHVAHDAMQMDVHKTLHFFITIKKFAMLQQQVQ